jgi:hypothetical protein
MGLASAPSGLTAAVAPVLDSDTDYDSCDDFCWEGDEYGADFGFALPNLNKSVAPYYFPSCSHVWAKITRNPSSLPSCSQVQVKCSTPPSTCWGSPPSCYLSLPVSIHQTLDKLALLPLLLELHGRFVVADTGATGHMLVDKTNFISYKSISNLLVRMGINLFIPVLGREYVNFLTQCETHPHLARPSNPGFGHPVIQS